jgi:hypothetical protein
LRLGQPIHEQLADRLPRGGILRDALLDAPAGIGDDAGGLDGFGAVDVRGAGFEPEELAGEDEVADVAASVAQHAEDAQRAAHEAIPAPRRIALGEDRPVAVERVHGALRPNGVGPEQRVVAGSRRKQGTAQGGHRGLLVRIVPRRKGYSRLHVK